VTPPHSIFNSNKRYIYFTSRFREEEEEEGGGGGGVL